MAVFQVHPHFGYLNSDVRLINGSNAPLHVKDVVEGNEYIIPSSSDISVRLNAGKHTFTIPGEESIAETVVIEDAIKLGGSKQKRTYVFEGTPWLIMVMLDRTYFYNRDTNEQYVENGLVPESIQFLTPDYLLFVTEKDHTIFSLERLTVVATFNDSSFRFSNSQLAILALGDSLTLISLDGPDKEQTATIECDDYIIDKSNQLLFYHNNDPRLVIKKDLCEFGSLEEKIRLEQDFFRLVGCHSVIYGANPRSLGIINLISNNSSKLYNDLMPVSTLNGKTVWNNDMIAFIEDGANRDAFISTCELTVYEKGDRWYYVRKTNYIFKNNGWPVEDRRYSLHQTNDKRVFFFDSSQAIEVIVGNSFDCAKTSGNNVLLIYPEEAIEYTGSPVVSPRKDILFLNQENGIQYFSNPLDLSFKQVIESNGDVRLFQESGLIRRRNDSGLMTGKICTLLQDVFSDETFLNDTYQDLPTPGFFRLLGGTGDFVHSLTGSVRPMPCTRDRLISISEECNFALSRDEKGFIISQYHSESKQWISMPLEEMQIDDSFYSRAVFCSDGKSIIYQKQGPEYYLRELGSNEETMFTLEGAALRKDFNGYRPYMDFDSHKLPVYIDPVTLRRVEPAAVGQFTFQSADGLIQHVSHNVEKYFFKKDQVYVPADTYKQDLRELDGKASSHNLLFNGNYQRTYTESPQIGPEQIQRARKEYYNNNSSWLEGLIRDMFPYWPDPSGSNNSCYLDYFLKSECVCDNILYRIDCFDRERVAGETIDIKLPYRLYFLNCVSYSADNRYIMICGKFVDQMSGLCLIYDVVERKIIHCSTSTKAVWLGAFSKTNGAAYYDSEPDTFVLSELSGTRDKVPKRSFLTYSPSGKYIALSSQGYIPYSSGSLHWGHQPSSDVYLVRHNDLQNEIAHYCDHGDAIENSGNTASVASATFSSDDKKLMTVSKDGVVVVRNLHFMD